MLNGEVTYRHHRAIYIYIYEIHMLIKGNGETIIFN